MHFNEPIQEDQPHFFFKVDLGTQEVWLYTELQLEVQSELDWEHDLNKDFVQFSKKINPH